MENKSINKTKDKRFSTELVFSASNLLDCRHPCRVCTHNPRKTTTVTPSNQASKLFSLNDFWRQILKSSEVGWRYVTSLCSKTNQLPLTGSLPLHLYISRALSLSLYIYAVNAYSIRQCASIILAILPQIINDVTT